MTPHYVHGHAEPVLRSHLSRTAANSAAYLLPHLRPGMSVLDVGCGPGTITVDLAEAVSPGRVVAVDTSEQVVEQTRRLVRERGVADRVEVLVADVTALDGVVEPGFDVVHAHQVLQHVADPVAALRAMAAAARPGGLVAARDADYAAFTWYPQDPRLDRWLDLYRRLARAAGGEPDAGRRLLAWARAAGLTDVRASASVWCYADDDSRAWWGGLWADRIVASGIAEQALACGAADRAGLEDVRQAWLAWAGSPDGWFLVPHGEVLATARPAAAARATRVR